MVVNIEVTTKCNFDCDYCYTKQLGDGFLSRERFAAILASYRTYHPLEFRLVGEGEPLLHPHFWDFARQAKAEKYRVTTISNGSTFSASNREAAKGVLDHIWVSLDTMDAAEAERVGRHQHAKVVANIRSMVQEGLHISLLSTNYGQDLSEVKAFAASLGINQEQQVLSTKNDYQSSYTLFPQKPVIYPPLAKVSCRALDHPLMRFHSLKGAVLPCCFIKDLTKFISIEHTAATMRAGEVPSCCHGCPRMQFVAQSGA